MSRHLHDMSLALYLPIMSESTPNYGEYLVTIRKEAGISQAELGRRTGYKVWSISDYETGRSKIFDDVLVQCAKALGVTPNELLGFTDFKDESSQYTFLINQAQELSEDNRKRFLDMMRVVLKGLMEEEIAPDSQRRPGRTKKNR